MSSFKINKIYTENPYVDEMVYYTKLLGMGTVLKMKDVADKNETAESLKNGDLYISCIEGTAIIEVFPAISNTAFAAANIYSKQKIDEYRMHPEKLTTSQRTAITKALINEYIEMYNSDNEEFRETNSYYRMLHGLPEIGRADYVEDWYPPEDIGLDTEKLLNTPIHLMTESEISILEQYGIIDAMIEKDSTKRQYMKYLGNKAIDYYLARRANRFDVLYIPEIESDSIYQLYRDKIDDNKMYVLRTIYSEAFKYGSEYYDNIMAIFIVLITMLDIISRVQEFITRKEIFDIRSVQYIFKSNGVPFFGDIPLKYQINMVKNLHTLLKYKSTSKCMVDICSMFGFDNIKIFKYYLLKDRNINPDTGEYVYATDEDGNEDLDAEYALKFIRLPLDEDLDKYIRSNTNYHDYDEITLQDATWDGGLNHDDVKKMILKEEFNLARTKYMSIDSVSEIAKMSIQQSYFFNILFDNAELENLVTIQVPYIASGRSFKVSDIFTLLTALTYMYKGYKDIIVEADAANVLYVNGFNFKADLAVLAQEVADSSVRQPIIDHATKQVKDFIIPNPVIPSFNEMMNMYVNNLKIRDALVEGMRTADNKTIYDIYKKLYDSLMIVELTFDHYKNPNTGEMYIDDEGDATYTEFLRHRDLALYGVLGEVGNFTDETARDQYIATVIDSIIYALEEYIDTTEFQSLFSGIPAMSSEAVKQYISTVINFYKSYKVDFLGLNTVYTIDDKIDGLIHLIDKIDFTRLFDKVERVHLDESFKTFMINLTQEDRIELVERVYMEITRFVNTYAADDVKITEEITNILVDYFMHSIIDVIDGFSRRKITSTLYESLKLPDAMSHIITLMNHDDRLDLHDRVWIYPEGIIKELSDPYMTFVSGEDVNKVLIADETGGADVSVYITEAIDSNSDNLVTEAAVTEYANTNALSKVSITGTVDTKSSSDSEVLTEEAIVKALTFIVLKD